MDGEIAAMVLWDYNRWLTNKEESFSWTRSDLAAAFEMAGRALSAEPRKYCHDCIFFRPQEGDAPEAEFLTRILCMKGLVSWFAESDGDPEDFGYYRPGCREFCEIGASSEWAHPRINEARSAVTKPPPAP